MTLIELLSELELVDNRDCSYLVQLVWLGDANTLEAYTLTTLGPPKDPGEWVAAKLGTASLKRADSFEVGGYDSVTVHKLEFVTARAGL